MQRRRARHPHGVRATRLALAIVGSLAIITSAGCEGGGWSRSLFGSARNGNLGSAERYLDRGEDINARRAEDGRTPLHAATERGHRKMVTFLLNKGASGNADATIRNNAGRRPLDLAKAHPEVSKDLRNAGG